MAAVFEQEEEEGRGESSTEAIIGLPSKGPRNRRAKWASQAAAAAAAENVPIFTSSKASDSFAGLLC